MDVHRNVSLRGRRFTDDISSASVVTAMPRTSDECRSEHRCTSAGTMSWSTQTEAQNVNAHAIRWGTMHSFRFVANAPPTVVTATLDHFTGGGSSSVEILAPSGDFTLPVTGLTCNQNGESVDLSWGNGEVYDLT